MFGSILIGILAVFFAVVLVRTLQFKPKAQPAISQEEISFDHDGAVQVLASLVKCKTNSLTESCYNLACKIAIRIFKHRITDCDIAAHLVTVNLNICKAQIKLVEYAAHLCPYSFGDCTHYVLSCLARYESCVNVLIKLRL